jgi:hypothetical protein
MFLAPPYPFKLIYDGNNDFDSLAYSCIYGFRELIWCLLNPPLSPITAPEALDPSI